MKNILVPTDFSKCADNALNAASKLATRFDAVLHVLHSEDLPPYWEHLPEAEKKKWAAVKKASAIAALKLDRIKKRYSENKLITSSTPRPLPEAINNYSKDHGIELIVMGSHGSSGKNEFFIGSNTQKVVRMVHAPTLVVKYPLENINFPKVVFASGFQESEMKAFLYFKNIIKHFIPEIHLVHIQHAIIHPPLEVQKESMKPFEKAAAPLPCFSHIYNDLSVDTGIRSFARELGADLIAISNHEKHPLKRMLIGSNVEAVINHSELPVLTIDFQK